MTQRIGNPTKLCPEAEAALDALIESGWTLSRVPAEYRKCAEDLIENFGHACDVTPEAAPELIEATIRKLMSEPPAEAALRDRDYAEKCRTENARLRAWLAEALAEKGVPSDTSTANFILARFASQNEAEACDEYLKSEGLIVRRVAGYNLPPCLRITIGDEPSCRRVAHAIGQFKEGAR